MKQILNILPLALTKILDLKLPDHAIKCSLVHVRFGGAVWVKVFSMRCGMLQPCAHFVSVYCMKVF